MKCGECGLRFVDNSQGLIEFIYHKATKHGDFYFDVEELSS